MNLYEGAPQHGRCGAPCDRCGTDMNLWRIDIEPKTQALDVQGNSVLADLRDFGIRDVKEVTSSRLFLLHGGVDRACAEEVARRLVVDPVTERYTLTGRGAAAPTLADDAAHVEVYLLPGVMDPVANSTLSIAKQEGLAVEGVRTGRRYVISPAPGQDELELIATRLLANECIEEVHFGWRPVTPPPEPPTYALEVGTVPIRDLDDAGLDKLSVDGDLFLSVEEMRTIRDHYRGLDRDPSDVELEMLAQTWSEHCGHKTFKSQVRYTGTPMPSDPAQSGERQYGNLLGETVARATHELIDEGRVDWCLSIFEDNAGIIVFDDDYGVAIKVETHNHPSAIEPYGGAATGIGGVIRDIIGCGLGAKPIANTDVFCFASPDMKLADLPKGVLHPRRVMKGVVSGVRDYGNRMGIPTVNGAINFDQRYLGNPLVFCGCIGLIPRDMAPKGTVQPGDLVVVVGGRTGRDGIHGATFSSAELTASHADEFSHAVQIGDAITEKMCLDVLMAARDHEDGPLFNALTDCGAGGLSSAVGEMGEHIGAVVDLEAVPLKYAGLRYDEIWISEAQERMVLAVPPDKLATLMTLAAGEDVEAAVIGTFGNDGRLTLRYNGTQVGELDAHFLHHGGPKLVREAHWERTVPVVRAGRHWAIETGSMNDRLLRCLSDLNVASKEWVIRQYDHEVQGGSVVKPLVGPACDGPSDAAVVRPRLDSDRGIAIASGLCPDLGDVDPYWMAVAAIDEAVRNVVCVGGDPTRTAILDNFCWGNCNDPVKLGALVRASQGCYDAAKTYGTPFVSGKDSLNNEFAVSHADAERLGLADTDGRIAIPHTLLVTATAIVHDTARCVTSDLKATGNLLVLAGVLRDCWDDVDLAATGKAHAAVATCIAAGMVVSAHDCNEGGAALAVAEMAIAGRLGAQCWLDESLGLGDPMTPLVSAYVLEVSADKFDALQAALAESGVANALLGRVSRTRQVQWFDRLKISNGRIRQRGRLLIDLPVDALAEAWQQPLRW